MNDLLKVSSKFHPGLAYNYKYGVFYRLKKTEDKLVVGHILFPNAEGMLQYFCVVTEKNKKVKPLKAAYEIFNERKITRDERVYPKDLDDSNWKADNLGILHKDVIKKLSDALYNVRHGVIVENNHDKPYTYLVKWRENGKIKSKTVYDITAVYRLKRIIMWKSCKMVSKYIVST